MRVFVTGATGFVGSAVVAELLAHGHSVLGLARSEAGAAALAAAGAEVHRGALEDLDGLTRGAALCDGVVHTGFVHDFARFAECCAVDRAAIGALGDGLPGSDRPLLVTAGLAIGIFGRLITEADAAMPASAVYPRASEDAAAELVARGIRAGTVRLPPSVHGDGDHGFVPILTRLAREKGVSAYVGEGLNRWPAVHRTDAAAVYRLGLERMGAGDRFHAVADEGVAFRDIAEVIGRRIGVPAVGLEPEAAAAHFGWMTHFAAMDVPTSSAVTRARLGWAPTGPGLLDDIDRAAYFAAAA